MAAAASQGLVQRPKLWVTDRRASTCLQMRGMKSGLGSGLGTPGDRRRKERPAPG